MQDADFERGEVFVLSEVGSSCTERFPEQAADGDMLVRM